MGIWILSYFSDHFAPKMQGIGVEKGRLDPGLPLLIGMTLLILQITGHSPKVFGNNISEFPETMSYMLALFWECCMQIGLIPTNERYDMILKESSLPLLIMDDREQVYYASNVTRSMEYTIPEMGENPDYSLHRMAFPGGTGYWISDLSKLNRMNEQLENILESLQEEAELIRLETELKEKNGRIAHRSSLYDRISDRTAAQMVKIRILAEQEEPGSDQERKKQAAIRICFYSVYIKRTANLMLLADEKESVSVSELGLALVESLRQLNQMGIPGDYLGKTNHETYGEQLIYLYECFEILVEQSLNDLKGVYATIQDNGEGIVFKLTLENGIGTLPKQCVDQGETLGIRILEKLEDDIVYLRFLIGGDGNE